MTNESVDRRAWPDAANWPAEEAPPDFAERTVSALLASREGRVARMPRARWVRLVLLAAFVSASAWATYRVTQGEPSAAVAAHDREEPRVEASSLAFAPPPTRAIAERSVAVPESAHAAPLVAKRPVAEAVEKPPLPRVPAPRCQCAPGFVVCGCSE